MIDSIIATLCLAIFIGCVVLLTRIIVQELRKPKKSFMAFLGDAIQGQQGDRTLINRYIETTGDSKYAVLMLSKVYVTEKLLAALKQAYPTARMLSQVCDINRKNCEFTYELRSKNGEVFILRFNSEDHRLRDNKERLQFVSNSFEITDYEFTANKVNFVFSMEIVHGAHIEYHHDDLLDLQDVLTSCEADYINYPVEMLSPVRLHRLARALGGLTVQPYHRDITPQDAEMLNVAYEEVAIDFHGERHSLPMSDAVDWMVSALSAGENVYMFGETGVGKTRLSEEIQLRVVNSDPDTNCIQVTTSMLSDIKSIGGLDAFVNALQAQASKGIKNILVFDEAESALEAGVSGVHTELNSLMLQLLDGSIRRDLNLTCVLIFNAKPNKLNPIAFRRGRAGVMIELKPLGKERAVKLTKILQGKIANKVFDNAMFEKLVTEQNFLSNGTMYAGANEITLADVYACFMDRDTRAILIEALRRKAGIVIPKREKKPVAEVIADAEPSPTKAKPKAVITEEEPVARTAPTVPKRAPVANGKKKKKKRRR